MIERAEKAKITKEGLQKKGKDISGTSYTQMNPIQDRQKRETRYSLFTGDDVGGFQSSMADEHGNFKEPHTMRMSSQPFCRSRSPSGSSSADSAS